MSASPEIQETSAGRKVFDKAMLAVLGLLTAVEVVGVAAGVVVEVNEIAEGNAFEPADMTTLGGAAVGAVVFGALFHRHRQNMKAREI